MDIDGVKIEIKSRYLIGIPVVVILLIVGLLSIATVGAGEKGILLTWGAVEQRSLGEGLHFKIPMAQNIVSMDVKTKKYPAFASSASKDLQEVTTEITLNYHIQADKAYKIYQEIGTDYEIKVIQPAVQEVVKSVTARFNAEELITKRPMVKQEIEEALKVRLLVYGVIQETVSITEFSFSEGFNQAIELKVTASQDVLKEKTILEKVEIVAQQRIAEAKGVAGAIRAEASAQADAKLVIAKAEAEALRLQKEELTPDLLELRAIEKWNGELPYLTGGGAVPFININPEESS